MISRDALFVIGMIVGRTSLMFGVMGQTAFISPVIKRFLPLPFAVLILSLPILILFSITYLKQSILSPRQFRFCLLFALSWFAVLTVLAEVLCQLGYMPPDGPEYGRTFARVLMHLGWLSTLDIIPLYLAVRRFETKQEA
jgi:hypothetical protein